MIASATLQLGWSTMSNLGGGAVRALSNQGNVGPNEVTIQFVRFENNSFVCRQRITLVGAA